MSRSGRRAAWLALALIAAGCTTERATSGPPRTGQSGSSAIDGPTVTSGSPSTLTPLSAPSQPTAAFPTSGAGTISSITGTVPTPTGTATPGTNAPTAGSGGSGSSTSTTTSSPAGSSAPSPTSTSSSNSTPAGSAAAASTSTSTSTSTTNPTTTTQVTTPSIGLPGPARDGVRTAPGITDAEQQVLDDFAKRAAERYGAADGISVAIAKNGQLVGSYVHGKDVNGTTLTETSRFRLASISKLITAIAVMRLADDGVIDIDLPLVHYWTPAEQPADAQFATVTIRELLNHSSGVQKLRDTFFGTDIDWRSTAERAAGAALMTPPGTVFAYSNANFTLLGRLIEKVTGEDYQAAIHRLVLQPMGITTAKFMKTTEMDPGDAIYQVGQDRWYMEALGPAGGWAMSADDLARLASLRTPAGTDLLSAESAKRRRTPSGLDTRTPDWRYGLGLMIFNAAWGHTGTIESARNFVLTMPNGYTVTVLASTVAASSGEQLIRTFLTQVAELAQLPRAS